MGFLKELGVSSSLLGRAIDIASNMMDGESVTESVKHSFRESIQEGNPITSYAYNSGKSDGYREGTIDQAERDERKMRRIQEDHERDREEWEREKQEYDDLLDEAERSLDD